MTSKRTNRKPLISKEKKQKIKEQASELLSDVLTDLEPIVKKNVSKLFSSLENIVNKNVSKSFEKTRKPLKGENDEGKEKSGSETSK